MCKSDGLYFWPKNTSINKNSIFVISGYAQSQTIINGLGKNHKVFVKSGKLKIQLFVQKIYVGTFGLTQAILKPIKELKEGLTYELIIENLGEKAGQVSKYNSDSGKNEKIKWKVSSKKDTSPPIWINKPIFRKNTYQGFGCGPAVYSKFTFSASDNSEFLVKTTLKNKTTGKETTYYIDYNIDQIEVGHGMCSGAFSLEDGIKYEIEFSLMDSSGNVTNWSGNRLEFVYKMEN
jgi:hypothetical protein